jgi:alpha-galactosidase
MQLIDSWVGRAFGDPRAVAGQDASRLNVPFSFKYDGKLSGDLLRGWEFSSRTEKRDKSTLRVNSYKDPNTGLLIECEIKTYPDSAAVDWVFYLSNTGSSDTAIIEGFMPLDATDLFQGDILQGPTTLRWSKGDPYKADGNPIIEAFLPHDELLPAGKTKAINGVYSSSEYLPFFNIQGKDGGWVLAVGWTGTWIAEFTKQPDGVHVRSGMAKTHFRLKSGERVRTPRMVLLRWNGDEMIHGHNEFRRLMLKHYVQWRDGRPAMPLVSHPTTTNMVATGIMPNIENQSRIIEKAAKLGVEQYWMDAYWMPQPWYENWGIWDPRPEDFPDGLRPLADAAHRKGMKFSLWFVSPWVSSASTLARTHPEFIDGGANGGWWKMGDPVAREFMTNHISERIKKWDVDIYREDGGYSLPAGEQAEDRVGVAEMKYLEGWYKFWSDLMDRNPGLLIDNCCGGGKRIDLETCSRSYVLWRTDDSDVQRYEEGQSGWANLGRNEQVMTAGLSLYFPMHSGVAFDMNPYGIRSAMTGGVVIHGDIERKGFPTQLCRQGIAETKELRPLFLGDIYPLLHLTSSQKDWYAFQLDRPDLKEGCVLVFRRPESKIIMCELNLYRIDPEAIYNVSITGETYRQGPWKRMSGSELMNRNVTIAEKPGSVLLRYIQVGHGK